MLSMIRRFAADKTGSLFVEYAVLTSLIGVGLFAAYTSISDGGFDIDRMLP